MLSHHIATLASSAGNAFISEYLCHDWNAGYLEGLPPLPVCYVLSPRYFSIIIAQCVLFFLQGAVMRFCLALYRQNHLWQSGAGSIGRCTDTIRRLSRENSGCFSFGVGDDFLPRFIKLQAAVTMHLGHAKVTSRYYSILFQHALRWMKTITEFSLLRYCVS